MDFWDLTKLMVRRWYISVTLLALTIAGTAYTAVDVKPDYQITSYVQLIPPSVVSDPTKAARVQNPWLALGITSLSNAAMVATQDQTFLDTLKKQDGDASFEITIGDQNPVAVIEVVAPTLDQAESATALINRHYSDSAAALQNQYGVKASDMITAYRLDKGENVKRPGGKVKRAVVVIFAVGILLTGGLTILFDTLLRRRRRTKTGPADDTNGHSVVAGAATVARPGVVPIVPRSSNGVASVPRRTYGRDLAEGDARETTRPLGEYVHGAARAADRDIKRGPGANGSASVGSASVGNASAGDGPAAETMPPDATIVLPRGHLFRGPDDIEKPGSAT